MLEHGLDVTTPRKKLVPGLYEDLVDEELDKLLKRKPADEYQLAEKLTSHDTAEAFARYLYTQTKQALRNIKDIEAQRRLIDELLIRLDAGRVHAPTRQLRAVAAAKPAGLAPRRFPDRPMISLADSDLLFNTSDARQVGPALISELPSADGVDLICAFINKSGLAVLDSALRELANRRPKRLRVLTTTYTGVTDEEALEQLRNLGAVVKVDYEGSSNRLHAKAWLLHRDSGLTTAYVGSSNISRAALYNGREWNVRLTARENPHLIVKLGHEFEKLWESSSFEDFDRERFVVARSRERGSLDTTRIFAHFDLVPKDFQQLILDKLRAARELHGQHRNLVVAATGTGKTMIAAFDYRNMKSTCPRLLFVAHRKEILQQALATFQAVLHDPHFGELLVDGRQPSRGTHVFASIQSLQSRLQDISADDFDFVIIDEFHHAEAKTYKRLIAALAPRELLGLTATPERGDGTSVVDTFFAGRITAELRLWDALAQDHLCPFHYYGIADDIDLTRVRWQKHGYVRADLEKLYTNNNVRVKKILDAIQKYIPDPGTMRALGFCVGIEHAQFMAKQFSNNGYPSTAIVGTDTSPERDAAIAALRNGQIRVLFCVDIFNEGVDIPEVDTLFFLRPTESATLFLQQLGRGLRKHGVDKVTTVLDFIGNARAEFRFDHRFRAFLREGTKLPEQIAQGFPWLPAGCVISLEPKARDIVLSNVKRALENRRGAISELQQLAQGQEGVVPTLAAFLDSMQWRPEQLYRDKDPKWTFAGMCQDAGLRARVDFDPKIINSLSNFLHIDDKLRLEHWQAWLAAKQPPKMTRESKAQRRLMTMLLAVLFNRDLTSIDSLAGGTERIWRYPVLRDELRQLLGMLADNRDHIDQEFALRRHVPLRIHASYQRDEILAACGELDVGEFPNQQIGIRRAKQEDLILNFVTVSKGADYSSKNQYRDFAMSPTRFHTESTHSIGPSTGLGRKLAQTLGIEDENELKVLLFVRPRKKDERGLSMPYVFLGPTILREYAGDRPMQLTWELTTPIPVWLYPQTCLTT